MDIEIIGFAGFAVVAGALARTVYARRLDVLHGPYIQRLAEGPVGLSVKRGRKSVETALDRFRSLEGARQDHLATAVAC
jgi:hypothetical protein